MADLTNKPLPAELPLVSVCIPVYNGERYLEETVRSVANQKYPNMEIIIQDNASTDGTWELVQKLAVRYSQLSVMRNEANVGMAPNWNLAVNRAKGDYLMLLSADDLLEAGFLERCLQLFAREKVDAVTTNHYWLRDGVKKQRKMRIPATTYSNFSGLILSRNPFSINFSLFTRDAVERLKVGGRFFSSNLYSCDYDMWIRCSLSGMRVCYTEEPLGTYRVHANNLSRQVMRMHRHAAMAVLKHSRDLQQACGVVYAATLVRFLYRVVSSLARHRRFDRKQFKVVWVHLFRFMRGGA